MTIALLIIALSSGAEANQGRYRIDLSTKNVELTGEQRDLDQALNAAARVTRQGLPALRTAAKKQGASIATRVTYLAAFRRLWTGEPLRASIPECFEAYQLCFQGKVPANYLRQIFLWIDEDNLFFDRATVEHAKQLDLIYKDDFVWAFAFVSFLYDGGSKTQYAEMFAHSEKWFKRRPNDGLAVVMMAFAYGERGRVRKNANDLREGIRLYERALTMNLPEERKGSAGRRITEYRQILQSLKS